MIKVYYKSMLKPNAVYEADSFHFVKGNPFQRNGLYIRKSDRVIAIVTDTDSIDRVEYVNNQPENVVFNFCDILSRYDKEEITAEDLAELMKDELNEYFSAVIGGRQ